MTARFPDGGKMRVERDPRPPTKPFDWRAGRIPHQGPFASLRAMIDFRRPQFASLRPQRSSKSASSSTPSTIKSKVPGVGAGSTIRPSPYSSFRDT